MVYPLVAALQPSRILLVWGILIHVLVGSLVLLAPSEIWLKFLIGLLIIASFLRFLFNNYREQGRCGFGSIQCSGDKSWTLVANDGTETKARLAGDYECSLVLILYLRLEDSGRRCSVLIFRDAVDEQTFRILRAALRLGACS
ncbi:MAG: protein YgfX [Thiotrichales bacterium]